MGKQTGISWTDHTFNPWTGCAKVSPGCANCYAETQAKRFSGSFGGWGIGQPRKRTSPANWRGPWRWDRDAAVAGVRHKVFCASMADWLDPEVPASWLVDLLALIANTPRLDWQLLTKRPELWRERMAAAHNVMCEGKSIRKTTPSHVPGLAMTGAWLDGNPPANVWVGTTAEDQRRADERIPALLAIPARLRFLSCEPLLGSVRLDLDKIGWVIVGGESGARSRPLDLEWARGIVLQCVVSDVACFVKQMGDNPIGGAFNAYHGADPNEWPNDLRVQEFPEERK